MSKSTKKSISAHAAHETKQRDKKKIKNTDHKEETDEFYALTSGWFDEEEGDPIAEVEGIVIDAKLLEMIKSLYKLKKLHQELTEIDRLIEYHKDKQKVQ